MIGEATASRLMCSRARCLSEAAWRIEWRNPRIHDADRVKVWLACADHRDYLAGFLRSRSFPVAVAPIEAAQA